MSQMVVVYLNERNLVRCGRSTSLLMGLGSSDACAV